VNKQLNNRNADAIFEGQSTYTVRSI